MKKPRPIKGIKELVTKRRPVISEVVRETTSGGVVYRKNNDKVEILLMKDAKDQMCIRDRWGAENQPFIMGAT